MYDVKHIAIELIRSQVSDYTPECIKLDNKALTDLMNFAADQDMTNTISKALIEFNMVDDEDAISQLMVEQYGGILRYQKQKYATERMCAAFDECGIPYILLKGAVIRQYYPQPELRTSSDVDILVKEPDRQSAIDCLKKQLNCIEKSSHKNNISYYTDDGVHIELHRSMIDDGYTFSKLFKNPWSYAKHIGGYEYGFSNEHVYLYHYVHMAKHFFTGGFGIRFVLDSWLLDKNMSVDRAELNRMLVEGGIKEFTDAVIDLSKVWFDGAEHNGVTAALEKHLFESGIYGNLGNQVVMKERMNGGRIRYMFKRIFMPISQLKKLYPILDKYPVLYPLYLAKRYRRILKKSRGKAMYELKAISTSHPDDLDELFEKLGMKDNMKRR